MNGAPAPRASNSLVGRRRRSRLLQTLFIQVLHDKTKSFSTVSQDDPSMSMIVVIIQACPTLGRFSQGFFLPFGIIMGKIFSQRPNDDGISQVGKARFSKQFGLNEFGFFLLQGLLEWCGSCQDLLSKCRLLSLFVMDLTSVVRTTLETHQLSAT